MPDDRAKMSRALLGEIAMDIGKETVAYVKVVFPDVVAGAPSAFHISLRNYIHNQIMAAFEIAKDGTIVPQFVTANEHGEIVHRLTERKAWRRKWLAQWAKIRENKPSD